MFKYYFAATLLASTTFAVKLAEESQPSEEEKKMMYKQFDQMLEEADADKYGQFSLSEYIDYVSDMYGDYADMDEEFEFDREDEKELVDMITTEWATIAKDREASMDIEDLKRAMRARWCLRAQEAR